MVANIFYFTFETYLPWQTPRQIVNAHPSLGLPQRWAFFHKFSKKNRGIKIDVHYKDGAIQSLPYPTYQNMNWWEKLILAERYRKFMNDNFLVRGNCGLRISLAQFYLSKLSNGLASQPITEIKKIQVSFWSQEIKNPEEQFLLLGQDNLNEMETKSILEFDPIEDYANCE